MYVLVLYDVPKDSLRKRLSDCCLNAGLERLQYSVFLGVGGKLFVQELIARLRSTLGDEEGLVHILPVHRDQLEHAQVLFNDWPQRRA